jgi:putative transposase
MLTETRVEELFAEWQTPEAGRRLIRQIRASGPVRKLQHRNDGVRTRYISRKMDRALYAESRTCEFPGIYIREHDPETTEIWPQPCTVDLLVEDINGKVQSRQAHTPDLFLIEHGFIIEEWREEERLHRYAMKRPHNFFKDESGQWRHLAAEKHFEKLGITYRLRSSDEHPRVFLSNLQFLEDYTLESAPAVQDDVRKRLVTLMAEHNKLPHLSLIHEHGFKADDIFQLVLQGDVYVDLYETTLHKTGELIIYRSEAVGKADAMFRNASAQPAIASQLILATGSKFSYDGMSYEVVLLGHNNVHVRDANGKSSQLPIASVQALFEEQALESEGALQESKTDGSKELFESKRLDQALRRLDALKNPESSGVPERTLRKWRQDVRGAQSPQEQLEALSSCYAGNQTQRLPQMAIDLLEKAAEEFFNTAKKPTVLATYNLYVTMCVDSDVRPMSKTRFYERIKDFENVTKREGKRKAYQKAPIPLSFDFGHPVHGVLPHEVCYCDHTILNQFLKGSVIQDLGKPTITVMMDGALAVARAFYLSYSPASAVAVLMCLRDYVRRHKRLPRILVLDNGREFHSEALKLFCSIFGITIRWRRRSRPRDSSVIERMLGVVEQEVISQLDGNSLALKDPRMVSTTHLPQKHIKWTLPALHGSIDYFLFDVHPNRIHPKFGITPKEMEARLRTEYGERDFCTIRDDKLFRLMTSPHSGKATRKIDRIRGVFIDGMHYWNDALAQAKSGEECEVRVELWRARIVYINFRHKWLVAEARDGGRLEGRYRLEFEAQLREETIRRRSLSAKDRISDVNSRKKTAIWIPEHWDSRLREQMVETYLLYERLGMTEVFEDAKNPAGHQVDVPLRRGSDLELIYAVEAEPDFQTPTGLTPESLEVDSVDGDMSTTVVASRPVTTSSAKQASSGQLQRVQPRQPQSEAPSVPFVRRPSVAVAVVPVQIVEEDYF